MEARIRSIGGTAVEMAGMQAAAQAAAEGLGIQWREVFEGVALMEEEAMRRQVRGGE